MKKIYLIAGEVSGDLHASNLMKSLLKTDDNFDFRFWGGDKMSAVSGKLVKHIKELAFMGFIEVVAHLPTILRNIRFCKNDILEYQPDVLVLIDYPGFNLRIAKWAKKHNIKVVYYISPQIWAWKQNRVYKIKKTVDKMLVILPFEKEFYARFGMEVTYVGHPLLDAIEQFKSENETVDFYQRCGLENRPIIALLPGSRKQEIKTKLPIMLEGLKSFTDFQLVIAATPSFPTTFYDDFARDYPQVKILYGKTYEILSMTTLAVVTSGTATLETALFDVPEVVCYKGSPISYHIAKWLIKVKYISLVNLICDKEVVKELIQQACTPENIKNSITSILPHTSSYQLIKENYTSLQVKLGKGGASDKAAKEILGFLNKI